MNLFLKKKLSKPLDLSVLKTDMHSHLIPCIDDGSQSMEESVDLIRRLYELGYKKIITTPHIQGEFFKNTPKIILTGLDALQKAVKEAEIPVAIEAAAEYLIDEKFVEKYKSGKLLTFGENYLLVELSFFSPPPNLKEVLFDLQIQGYKIILAHPERYTYWHNNLKKYEDLIDRNIFLQINAISLSNYYSLPIKKMAEKLIDQQIVSFLGTDAHNINYIKYLKTSLYEKSLEKLLSSGKLLNSTL